MILALVVTSLLIFLRAHCLIKRKRKGMCNWLINQHVHVNYKSDTTLIIDQKRARVISVVDTVPVPVVPAGMYDTGTYTGIETSTFLTSLNSDCTGHTG